MVSSPSDAPFLLGPWPIRYGPAMPAPRRVLLAQTTAERYGSDLAALELTRGLQARGWEVTVVLPSRAGFAEELEGLGACVVVTEPAALRRVNGPAGWWHWLRVLPGAVRRHASLARAVDVVHVNVSTAIAAGVGGRLARRPIVWHVRESYSEHRRMWRLLARVLIRPLASAVVVTSEDIAADAVAAGLHPIVVYDGLTFPVDVPGPCAGNRVLAVGRINDWKGHEVLVEAIGLVRAGGIDATLAIAGDVYPGGELHRLRLERMIDDKGLREHVQLLGFVDDVAALHRSAAVFVQPSRRPEPFGLALVEAMAAGLPCIATSAGGPREIVHDGTTGLLVPPGDARALASAISQLLEDPTAARTLGMAAAVDVRARFTADATVDATVAVYDGVMDERSRPRR